MSAPRGPKPTVIYDGKVYTCRAWKVEVPDLAAMDRLAALVWLNRHTIPKGVRPGWTPPPNLAGINLEVR